MVIRVHYNENGKMINMSIDDETKPYIEVDDTLLPEKTQINQDLYYIDGEFKVINREKTEADIKMERDIELTTELGRLHHSLLMTTEFAIQYADDLISEEEYKETKENRKIWTTRIKEIEILLQ